MRIGRVLVPFNEQKDSLEGQEATPPTQDCSKVFVEDRLSGAKADRSGLQFALP